MKKAKRVDNASKQALITVLAAYWSVSHTEAAAVVDGVGKALPVLKVLRYSLADILKAVNIFLSEEMTRNLNEQASKNRDIDSE